MKVTLLKNAIVEYDDGTTSRTYREGETVDIDDRYAEEMIAEGAAQMYVGGPRVEAEGEAPVEPKSKRPRRTKAKAEAPENKADDEGKD